MCILYPYRCKIIPADGLITEESFFPPHFWLTFFRQILTHSKMNFLAEELPAENVFSQSFPRWNKEGRKKVCNYNVQVFSLRPWKGLMNTDGIICNICQLLGCCSVSCFAMLIIKLSSAKQLSMEQGTAK